MQSIISLILILFSFNNHNAQVFNFGKDGTFSNNWHEGILVLNDGTKKKGLIKFESAVTKMYGMKMIGKIRFKDKESNKKKYSKLAIDYFEIENNRGDYEKYSYEKQSKNYDLLLRVLAEGKINLYSEDVYNTMPGFSGGYPVTKMYVKKEGDEFVEYENFNQIFKSFRAIAPEYFSDCPSLMSKINDKFYTSKDIIQVVEEYNNCFN